MGKQKRLNKNLVAFLTIMGVVLIVAVAALATRLGTRRDPEVLAASARERERAGDLGKAAEFYQRAFAQSERSQTKYLVDAARCTLELGDFRRWFELLGPVAAQKTDDPALLVTILEGLWRIDEIRGAGLWPEDWRNYADKLLQREPENVLGLVSRAKALWMLRGAEDMSRADEAAESAFKLAPRDPRAVLTYVALLGRRAQEQTQAARERRAPLTELQEVERQFVGAVLPLLADAVAEHPGDPALVITCAGHLENEALRQEREQASAAAAEHMAAADAVIEKALAANPDSAELQLAAARHLLARRLGRGGTAAEAGREELLTRAEQYVTRAIELEPALYDAYIVRGEMKLLRFDAASQPAAATDEQLEAALAVYEAASRATATLRNLRAMLTPEAHVNMLRRGFSTALAYFVSAQSADDRKARLARAKVFVDAAETKYGEDPLVAYTTGEYLVAEGRYADAVLAFEKAHRKAESPAYWFQTARVENLPTAQLALLYQELQQYGEAARWAELAFDQYQQVAGRVPSARLVNARAAILNQLGQPQRALDLLDQFQAQYPDERAFLPTRAAALAALGRAGESNQAVAAVTGAEAATQLWRARMAAAQRDFDAAEQLARAVLADGAASDVQVRDALALCVSVLAAADKQAAARSFVQTLVQSPPRPGMERLLRTYGVLLSEEDAQQRDAKILEIIQQSEDPLARAAEAYAFHASRGQYDAAATALAQLRQARPNDIGLVEQEFRLALQAGKPDQAAALLPTLAQHDDGRGSDGVGGALYRGELALAQNKPALAIPEFSRAVRSLPKSAELQTSLARAYLAAGRMAEGIAALEEAVAINPRFFEAHRVLMLACEQRAQQSVGPERAALEASAAKYLASAAALNPNHPDVKARTQRAEEDRDPRTAIAAREKLRTEKPDDMDNIVRLSELYLRAWAQADPPTGDAARQAAERADEFFQAVTPTLKEGVQLQVARGAAALYASRGQGAQGQALLNAVIERQSGLGRISAQLLLAGLLEAVGDPAAAENGYRQAQRIVPEAVTDADQRREAELSVGAAFAGFYERQRQWTQAAEVCRWLLDRLASGATPDPAQLQPIRRRLIGALLTGRQMVDAEAEIADYRKTYPDDLMGLVAQAQLRLARNEREAAQTDLTAVLRLDPENLWALFNRGSLALERGRYDEARADLLAVEKRIAREPDMEPMLRARLATLYESEKQLDAATAELRKLLDVLNAQNAKPEARQQAVSRLVRVLLRNKQDAAAQQLISDYMEKNPADPTWPLQLAALLESRGDTAAAEQSAAARQQYALAATYYQRGSEQCRPADTTRFAGATAARMRVLTKAGQAREAASVFGGLALAEQTPLVRAAAATALGELNETAAAREQWRTALVDAARQGSAPVGAVASALRSAVAAADAEALLREAAAATTVETDAGLRLRIALAAHLVFTGNPAGGLPVLDEVLAQAAAGSMPRLEALLNRAQTLEKAGRSEDAVQAYREILEAYGEQVNALNNLAYLLVTAETPAANRPREALQYAERLRELAGNEPNAATVLDTVGWVYFHNDKLPEAAAALEESLSLDNESNPVAYLHLGRVYAKLGRTAEARATWDNGLKLVRRPGRATEAREYEAQFKEQLDKLP